MFCYFKWYIYIYKTKWLFRASLWAEFESWCGHIWRAFDLCLRFITFGGGSAHLAYDVHKSGKKTSTITGEQYRKMLECITSSEDVWRLLQRYLMWSASHEIPHVTVTELRKQLDLELGRQCRSFSKFVRWPVDGGSVIFFWIFGKLCMRSWSAGAIALFMYVQTNSDSL